MEHEFDLHMAKELKKSQNVIIRKQAMKRCIAILLSIMLVSGTCLPAMAIEEPGIQTEEASGAGSNELEEVIEAQTENSGEELVSTSRSEEIASEDNGINETSDNQIDATADDNHKETIKTEDGGDTEIAGDALTIAATETAEEEEPESPKEPEDTNQKRIPENKNLRNNGVTSDELINYSYSIVEMNDGTSVVRLDSYYGADTEIEVPGTVLIEGAVYKVSSDSSRVWSDSVERLTFGEGFVFPQNSTYFFGDRNTLISVNLSYADLSLVTSMNEMFVNCANLREINMDSVDVSGVVEAWDMFAGCDSLETLVTPAYMYCDIQLPRQMEDQNGTFYSNVPIGSESIVLNVVSKTFEVTGWLSDYDFSVDLVNKIVFLENYKGSDSEITMPERVTLEGEEYQVKIQECPWKTGVAKLAFEGGDPFYGGFTEFFNEMEDLEVLDLSNIECSSNNYQSLDDCEKLNTIYLPVSLFISADRTIKQYNGSSRHV